MLRAVLLALACTACNAATVGIVKLDVDGKVRLFSLADVKPGTQIRFQYPGADGSARCCVRRSGRAFRQVESEQAAQDATSGVVAKSYELVRPLDLKIGTPFIGSAVVGSGRISQRADQSLQVGPKGRGEVVRSCTSQEGVHVVLLDATGLASDLYLGLGYDIESPTCVPTSGR